MAAGVLIGVLLMSLAVYLFIEFGSTSAEINAQNQQQQVTQFNSRFTSYEGLDELTIYDIITVLGYAQENNKYYAGVDEYQITVKLGTAEIQGWTEQNKINNINQERENMIDNKLQTYKCKISEYHQENGRVKTVIFNKQP